MKPISTALCSFGMSGWVFHAPFIAANPNYNLYAVWERTKNLAQEKYPAIKTFRTLHEMLADGNVELVVVNTPSITHYEYAKQALLAGKHVIVEKPFTGKTEEGEELIELSRKQNSVLSVYHNRRYDSDFKTIKKILDEGLLGNIVEAEFHYDRFDENLSYKIHKETPGIGVGSLYDLGSHLIDQALQFFGMPQAVFADIFAMRPISKVDDYFEVLLYYPSMRVRLKASYQTREALPGYVIHGSKGSFIKNKADVQERDLQAGKAPGSNDWGTEPEDQQGLLHTQMPDGKIIKEYITSEKGNYGEYYAAMYNAIRNKANVPVTANEGLNVIKIIEAAFQSNNEKKLINL
jgi:predicted dehydrogenase